MLYMVILPLVGNPDEYIGLLEIFGIIFMSIIIGIVFLFFMTKSTKDYKVSLSKPSLIKTGILFGIVFVILVGSTALAIAFLPDFYLPFPSSARVIVLILLMLWSVITVCSKKESGERILQIPTMIFALLTGFTGIATHTFFREQMLADFLGMNLHFYISQLNLIIFMVIFCGVMMKYAKEFKTKNHI